MNRTERRAAEHAARKLANKQAAAQFTAQAAAKPAVPTHPTTISPAQLAANRANALFSTGPSSPTGKAKAAMNALKHGLAGQTVVLAGEDNLEYNRRFDSYVDSFKPATEPELRLVQALLDCDWRLDRIKRIESSIFLKGTIDFKDKFEDRSPAERESLILAEIYLKYEKSIRNLNIQEARLLRTRDKSRAELIAMQKGRQRDEMLAAQYGPAPVEEEENGFDFETDQNAVAALPEITELASAGVLNAAEMAVESEVITDFAGR